MHTLWKEASRRDLLDRVGKLTPDSRPLWGKFTVDRMLAHLVDSYRMGLGELPTRSRRVWMRHWPLNVMVIYLVPWPKGVPTARELIARPPENFELELATMKKYIDAFGRSADRREWPEHPAFGKLSRGAWGHLMYRHSDHHLKQFGV